MIDGVPQPELGHRANDEVIFLWREELLDVADDARDIRDHVFREQDALDGIGAYPLCQGIDHDHPVEPEDPAYAVQT